MQCKLRQCLQAALACFEGKKKLLEQAKLLKNAFVVTAQEPLPDDLVTAVQVSSSHTPCAPWSFTDAAPLLLHLVATSAATSWN